MKWGRTVWCLGLSLLSLVRLGAAASDELSPETLTRLGSSPLLPPAPAEKLTSPSAATLRPETGFSKLAFLGSQQAEVKRPAIKTTPVDQVSGPVRLQATIMEPADQKVLAAVVLAPDWWGSTPELRQNLVALIAQQYRVVIVDLFDGKQPANRREATLAMRQVKPEVAMAQIRAALTLAGKQQPAPLKVGLVGLGFGAGLALQAATEAPSPLDALVLLHPEPLTDTARLAHIKPPMLLFFADRDSWITPQRTHAFQEALTQAHLTPELYHYDVQPGFFLRPNPDGTESVYSNAAHDTLLKFLDRELKR